MTEHCNDDFITDAVKNYSDMMFRVAYNITKNREDAFDVCQDVFVRLVRSAHKIRSEEHLKAWLLRATVNVSKTAVTSPHRRTVSDEALLNLTTEDELSELFDAVMRLPEKYSSVIHLFYYEDLKTEEIAAALKISRSAVKSRLQRGREMLKKQLAEE